MKDIHKLGGYKAFFSGIVPYGFNFLFNHVSYFGSVDEEYEDENGFYWLIFSFMLWNPLNIMIVRMQCLDFPHRKFRNALIDMIKHDRHRMLYAGLVPIFVG